MNSNQRVREWKAAHPERVAAYYRKAAEKRRQRQNLCRHCNEPMLYARQGRIYHAECQLKVARERDRKRRRTLRERIAKHKMSIGCVRCGYDRTGIALDWHHPNEDKERRITVRSYFTPLGKPNERSVFCSAPTVTGKSTHHKCTQLITFGSTARSPLTSINLVGVILVLRQTLWQ